MRGFYALSKDTLGKGAPPLDADRYREKSYAIFRVFAKSMGADPDQVRQARTAVSASLNSFTPAHDEAILAAGGFSDVSLFYAAFTFRGWTATRP